MVSSAGEIEKANARRMWALLSNSRCPGEFCPPGQACSLLALLRITRSSSTAMNRIHLVYVLSVCFLYTASKNSISNSFNQGGPERGVIKGAPNTLTVMILVPDGLKRQQQKAG